MIQAPVVLLLRNLRELANLLLSCRKEILDALRDLRPLIEQNMHRVKDGIEARLFCKLLGQSVLVLLYGLLQPRREFY